MSEPAVSEPGGRRKPWHKPTFRNLTDYLDTGGSPTDKAPLGTPASVEDETRPDSTQRAKSYRPATP